MSEGPIQFVLHDGSVMKPEPGPIWLDSYEYGERMYVPGWVTHDGFYNGMPHITMHRLEGPGIPDFGWLDAVRR